MFDKYVRNIPWSYSNERPIIYILHCDRIIRSAEGENPGAEKNNCILMSECYSCRLVWIIHSKNGIE